MVPESEVLLMFENLFLNLRSLLRGAARSVALVMALVLLSGTLSVAKNSLPAAGGSAVFDLGSERKWTTAAEDAERPKFRHDQHRHHVWIARFASLELRLEWESDSGRESWSATLQNRAGKQMASASAFAESGQCI